MKLTSSFIGISLSMAFALSFLPVGGSLAQDHNVVSKLNIDGDTVVRFSFKPPNSNFIRPPVIFRVADAKSPNWNTAPIDHYGRSVYIPFATMRSLVNQLESDQAIWQLSAAPRPIEPYLELPIGEDLVVTIYASNGMATASIQPQRLCNILAQLNDVLEMKRAHWELEYFRRGCGCHVPGYKSDEYPNDR